MTDVQTQSAPTAAPAWPVMTLAEADARLTASGQRVEMVEKVICGRVEAENVLYDHPDLMDGALIGRSHRTLGEEPVAIVFLKPGGTADEAALRGFVRERLAPFKAPIEVRLWPETLPRNAGGKIVNSELKVLLKGQS